MSDANPYQPPAARLQRHEAPTGEKYQLAEVPRARTFVRGWRWITEGFDYFLRAWRGWAGAMVIGIAIMVVVSFIPVVNLVFDALTYQVWIAGIAIGCRAQSEWQPFRVSHLFAGFRNRPGVLILLSFISYAAILLVVMGVMFAILPGWLDLPGFTGADGPFSPQFLIAVLLSMALTIPVLMATFFAPHLLVLHRVSLIQAIRLSLVGCLKNIMPFLLWGILLMAIAAIVGVIVMLPAVLLGLPTVAILLGLVFAILAPPTMFASIYVAYEDIFLLDKEFEA